VPSVASLAAPGVLPLPQARRAITGTLECVTAWREYQERAAYYFRYLGMQANVDEHVVGARGGHDVDVVVRASRAGIDQLWIVECKHWQRRVDKSHIGNLRDIVHDVGADRGILLSEKGFQSGAIKLARFSNITLSSLAGLKERLGWCFHEGTVEDAGSGWLTCTACRMVQPTDW
jgi:hypothetical protein